MEEKVDIFADLLSGLRPNAPPEPPREPFVSMDDSRRQALSDTELEPIPVRYANSPVGDNLAPPPPPVSKEEMKQLIQENVRELLFQNLSALTRTLRTALDSLGEKITTVEQQQSELKANVDTLLEKQGGDSQNFTENFRHVEVSLKEVSVGIQRMLEKQDLMDAHVLLNRHAREQQEEKQSREEAEMNRKSEKRVSVVQKEPVREAPEEEEEEAEEEDPPPVRVAPKKKPLPKPQPPPRNYAPEPKTIPVEPEPYVQEEKVVMKHATTAAATAAPVYASTQPVPMPRPSLPVSYAAEAAQPQQSPPPPQQPPQQLPPIQQPMSHPRPPPQQLTPMQSPQQSSFPPVPETAQYKSTPQPQPQPPPNYDYARHGMGNPNGYAPPSAEKPSQTPYPQHMPPSSAAPFGAFPPPLLPTQQPAMPMHPGPPGPYTGYPSIAGQQSYRSEQPPPPPPPHQTIYGSPAAIQAGGAKPNQRSSDAMRASPQSVPLDQVINDVANMGFDRTKVRSVVTNMLDHGEAVDLNVVIDRLTNMRY